MYKKQIKKSLITYLGGDGINDFGGGCEETLMSLRTPNCLVIVSILMSYVKKKMYQNNNFHTDQIEHFCL